jgi:hypothetical protein
MHAMTVRLIVALMTVLAWTSVAGVSAADMEECTQAHLRAQRLHKQWKLKAARAELLVCLRPECPAIARNDCGPWLAEVETEQPTVVVSAIDAAGRETNDVRVAVDGELVGERLDGRPIDLDPGEHVVRCEMSGAPPVERHLFVKVGDKNEAVRIHFELETQRTNGSSDRATHRAGLPVSALVAWGVGAAALGSFTYFGAAGHSRESSLASSCAPRCSQDDRDEVLRDYRIADVSLGVAVVALGVGLWLALAR